MASSLDQPYILQSLKLTSTDIGNERQQSTKLDLIKASWLFLAACAHVRLLQIHLRGRSTRPQFRTLHRAAAPQETWQTLYLGNQRDGSKCLKKLFLQGPSDKPNLFISLILAHLTMRIHHILLLMCY